MAQGIGIRSRLAVWAALVAAAVATAGCRQMIDGFGKTPEVKAVERVEFVLDTIQSFGGTTTDQLQTAICRWYNDKYHLTDGGELSYAMDQFEDWQKKAGIYPRLSSYEIVESRLEEEGSTTVLVLAKINGGYRWMRVPENATIAWAASEEEGG